MTFADLLVQLVNGLAQASTLFLLASHGSYWWDMYSIEGQRLLPLLYLVNAQKCRGKGGFRVYPKLNHKT